MSEFQVGDLVICSSWVDPGPYWVIGVSGEETITLKYKGAAYTYNTKVNKFFKVQIMEETVKELEKKLKEDR